MDESQLLDMTDADFLETLDELEEQSKDQVVDATIILDKVTDIERRLSYQKKVDKRIREKLDRIKELL